MAQTIQIPVDVRFTSSRRKWEVRSASIVELDFYGASPISLLRNIIPLNVAGKPLGLRVLGGSETLASIYSSEDYNLPFIGQAADLRSRYAPNGEITQGLYGGALDFEVVISVDVGIHREVERDAWEMREEFLSLKQTSGALSRFLSKWGDWDGSPLHVPGGTGARLGDKAPAIAIPEFVWERQTFYKAALCGEARDWMVRHARVPTPQRQLSPPFLSITDKLCSLAIETTITMDKLRDVPFRICERVDCGKLFELKTKHVKRYCSIECAHLVSVRRGREEKKNKAN